MKSNFSIIVPVMESAAAFPSPSLVPAVPRRMTRCECAGVSFEELAQRMRREGATLQDVCCRTGCGQTCTGCLPDLQSYLLGES